MRIKNCYKCDGEMRMQVHYNTNSEVPSELDKPFVFLKCEHCGFRSLSGYSYNLHRMKFKIITHWNNGRKYYIKIIEDYKMWSKK